MLAAIVLACASACGFSLSTSLQHRAAGRAPLSITGGGHLLRHLATRPRWVLGVVLGAVSFTLHAAALNLGAIAFVQPIMASGMIFAVPVRAWMDREKPSVSELRSVSIAVVGLVVFLLVTDADPSVVAVNTPGVVLFDLAAFAVVLALSQLAGRLPQARHQAVALGVAAGVLFGVVAGMLKVLIESLKDHGVFSLEVLAVVAFLALCGLVGMTLNQRAYRVAPLSMSMPVLNIVDVLVAMLFSLWLLGAAPASSWPHVLVQGLGLLIMWVGVREIARAHESAEARAAAPAADEPELAREPDAESESTPG
ncbi:MAG: DMT family transporter [Nocardioidaceae bacterium]